MVILDRTSEDSILRRVRQEVQGGLQLEIKPERTTLDRNDAIDPHGPSDSAAAAMAP